MLERIPLIDLEAGKVARVVEIFGGASVHNRLRALGIRPGVKVSKVSAAFGRGPVVVQIGSGSTQLALGFGMSYKVIVEVEQ